MTVNRDPEQYTCTSLEKARGEQETAEKLGEAAAALETLIPEYDRRDQLTIQRKEADSSHRQASGENEQAQKDLEVLSGTLEQLKAEQKTLEHAGEEKERLNGEITRATQKKDGLSEILTLFSEYNSLAEKLRQAQKAYKTAKENSEELWRDYEAKDRAFLDEQAGVLAQDPVRRYRSQHPIRQCCNHLRTTIQAFH